MGLFVTIAIVLITVSIQVVVGPFAPYKQCLSDKSCNGHGSCVSLYSSSPSTPTTWFTTTTTRSRFSYSTSPNTRFTTAAAPTPTGPPLMCFPSKCICYGNYSGDYCEIPPLCYPSKPAGSDGCGRNGRCFELRFSQFLKQNFACKCSNKYRGKYCQIAPVCTENGNECGKYGECNVCGRQNFCLCNSGYGGDTCNIPPVCTEGGYECQNGGWCDFSQTPYNCSCQPDFKDRGPTCEYPPPTLPTSDGHHVTFMTSLVLLPLWCSMTACQ